MIVNKKICILSFSNIAWDSRVLREVYGARDFYNVDVIAFGDWNPPTGVRYHQLTKTRRTWLHLALFVMALLAGRLFPRMYERAFWIKKEYSIARDLLIKEKYDLIHANDWNALPVSAGAARICGSQIVFDAHEYSFTEEGDKWLWRFLIVPFRAYLFAKYQDAPGVMITVSRGIYDLYHRDFGWQMEIILNAPPYRKTEFRPVDSGRIKLVHHGAAVESRYLEDFIRLISLLDDRFELNFFLVPTQPKYLAHLKQLAANYEPGRINFFNPANPKDVVRRLTKFDIGIPLLAATQTTYYNSLPNKFFDFIMAGLAIAVSPLPMMEEIVRRHNIGILSADQTSESMAISLSSIQPEMINTYKKNAIQLARILNAEEEMKKLKRTYDRLLK